MKDHRLKVSERLEDFRNLMFTKGSPMETTFSDVVRVYKVDSLDSANYTKEARERGLSAGFAVRGTPEKLLRGGSVHRVFQLSSDVRGKCGDGRFAVEQTYRPLLVGSEGHGILLRSDQPDSPTFLISHDGKWDAEIVGYEGLPGQQVVLKLSGRLLSG